jgi:hypothetical protein
VVHCQHKEQSFLLIPAQAGIQIATLDSRLRGNDGTPKSRFDTAVVAFFRSVHGNNIILWLDYSVAGFRKH